MLLDSVLLKTIELLRQELTSSGNNTLNHMGMIHVMFL